ncbi:hypothetical protein BG004_002085 [Podila humilis]|nr:hypothetical protein BG004_002085 [Podila humilis]
MPNDGSLDVLPLSPCTSGSLGLDHHFLGTVPLKVVENHSTSSLKQSHVPEVEEEAVVVQVNEIKKKEEEGDEEEGEDGEEEEEEAEMTEENEAVTENPVAVVHSAVIATTIATKEESEEEEEEEHAEMTQDEVINEHPVAAARPLATTINVAIETVEEEEEAEEEEEEEEEEEQDKATTTSVEKLTEKTEGLSIDLASTTSSKGGSALTTPMPVMEEEKMASGIPERPIKTSMPTYAAAQKLSAASLELKKKQAAENAAAATKAMSIEIPETDSISNRIKMFGGGVGGLGGAEGGGGRKLGVRDMVQKYKNVEESSQEKEIAHVVRGHQDMTSAGDGSERGVCAAYSLSTASRPANAGLRSSTGRPRRKMSHELSENETREVISGGNSIGKEEDRMGVSQESVQSVRNAKSLFENLSRSEGAQK